MPLLNADKYKINFENNPCFMIKRKKKKNFYTTFLIGGRVGVRRREKERCCEKVVYLTNVFTARYITGTIPPPPHGIFSRYAYGHRMVRDMVRST